MSSGMEKLKQPSPSDLKKVVEFSSSFMPTSGNQKLASEFLRRIFSYDSELSPENMFKALPFGKIGSAMSSFLTFLPKIQQDEVSQILTKIASQKEMMEGVFTVFPQSSSPAGTILSQYFTGACLGTAINAPQIRPFFRAPAGFTFFSRIFDEAKPIYPVYWISDTSSRLYTLLRVLPPNSSGKRVLICGPNSKSLFLGEQNRHLKSLSPKELIEDGLLSNLSFEQYYTDSSAITRTLDTDDLEKYKLQAGVIKDSEQLKIWQMHESQDTFVYADYIKFLLESSLILLKNRFSGSVTNKIGNADAEGDVAEEISGYIRRSGCLSGGLGSLESWVLDRLKGFGSLGSDYLNRIYDVLGLAGIHGLYVFDDSRPLDELKQQEIGGSINLDEDLGKNCFINIALSNKNTIFIYGSRARDPAEFLQWSQLTAILDHRLQILLSILRGSFFLAKDEDWTRIVDKTPKEIFSVLSPTLTTRVKGSTSSDFKFVTYQCRKCNRSWIDIHIGKYPPLMKPCPRCGQGSSQSSSRTLTQPPVPSSEKGSPFTWVTKKDAKPNLYKGMQFRYLTNFIGGRLHFLRRYFLGEGDLAELGAMTHPLDLWCLLLEIQYILGFFTTNPGVMVNREMWGIISAITTAIMGWDEVEKIKQIVESRLSSPEWEKESRVVNSFIGQEEHRGVDLVSTMRYCVANNEWERFVGGLAKYFRNNKRAQFEEEGEGEKEEEEEEKKSGGRKSFYAELIKDATIEAILLNRFPIMVKVAHFLRTHLLPVRLNIPDFCLPTETQIKEGRRVPSNEGLSRYLRIYSGIRNGRASGGKFRIRPKFTPEICKELESARFFQEPYIGFIKGGTPGSAKETKVNAYVFQCGKNHLTTRYVAGRREKVSPIRCPICAANARVLRIDQNARSLKIIETKKESKDYLEVINDDKDKTTYFAGNRWIYYAAMSVADRRIRNYMYNCGVEVSSGNNTSKRGLHQKKGKTINLLKAAWKAREDKSQNMRDLNLKIDSAIMDELKKSFVDFIYWARTKILSQEVFDRISSNLPRVKHYIIKTRARALRNRIDNEQYWDKYVLGKLYNRSLLPSHMRKIRDSFESIVRKEDDLSNALNFTWWNDALLCFTNDLLRNFVGIAYGLLNLTGASSETNTKQGMDIFSKLAHELSSNTLEIIRDTAGKFTSFEDSEDEEIISLLDSLCKAFVLYFEGKIQVLLSGKKEGDEEEDDPIVTDLKLNCIKYLKLIYALEYLTNPALTDFSFYGVLDTMGGFSFLLSQPGFLPSSGLNKIMGVLLATTIQYKDVWKYIKETYLDKERGRGYANFHYRHTGYEDVAGDLSCILAILLCFKKSPDSQEATDFKTKVTKAWTFRTDGIPTETSPEEIIDPAKIFDDLFTSFKDNLDVPPLLPREASKLGAITSSPSNPALGIIDFSKAVLSPIARKETRSIPFMINVPPLLNHLGYIWDKVGNRIEISQDLLTSTYDKIFKPNRNPLKPEVLFLHPGPVLHTQALESEIQAQRRKYTKLLQKVKNHIDDKTKSVEQVKDLKNKFEPFVQQISALRSNLRLIIGFGKSNENSQKFLDSIKSGLNLPEFIDRLRYWSNLKGKKGIYRFGFLDDELKSLEDFFLRLSGIDNTLSKVISGIKLVYDKLIDDRLGEMKKEREKIVGTEISVDFEEWGNLFVDQCAERISSAQADLKTNYRELHFTERELNRLTKLLLSKGWQEKTARGPRGAARRQRFQAALEYLSDETNCPLFHKYIYGCNMATEIRLDANVIEKIRAGALIASVQFLPHNRGKRHVIVNISLRGSPIVPIKFTSKVTPPTESTLFEDSTLGVDVNRIGCLRPLAFSIVHQKDEHHRPVLFPLELGSLSTDELSMLAQLYTFSGGGHPHSFEGRVKGNPAKTEPVKSGLIFLEKVSDTILRSSGSPNLDSFFEVTRGVSRLYIPTKQHPFSYFPENAEPSSSTFNDQLWAIPYYWTRLSEHVRDHWISCFKRLKLIVENCLRGMLKGGLINKKEFDQAFSEAPLGKVLTRVQRFLSLKGEVKGGKKTTGWDLKINRIIRLRRQMSYLENRMDNLHKSAIKYLFYATLFLLLKRPVARVSFEKVRFSTEGLRGTVAVVVQGMLKDFNDIRYWVTRQLEITKKKIPEFVQVRAAGTSQYCYSHLTGTIDNTLSPDYCPCSEERDIVDRHVNAASNIAIRFYIDRYLEDLRKKYESIIHQFNIKDLWIWEDEAIKNSK